MTYLVQVWRKAKGEWRTEHQCTTEAEAKRAVQILRGTGYTVGRVIAKPAELDVLEELHDMQHEGLVDVALVDGNWRWTLKEEEP